MRIDGLKAELERLESLDYSKADSSPAIAYELGRLDGLRVALELIESPPPGAILKPDQFNAVTLAELLWDSYLREISRFADLEEPLRTERIDKAQWVLDAMRERGIIG